MRVTSWALIFEMSIKGVKMFFFKKNDVKKTPTDILLSLRDEMLNYNKKYPTTGKIHYRQARAFYLTDFLNEKIHQYTYSTPDQKEGELKKILVELYLHYLSISQVSKFSILRGSLKKALTGLLNIKENSSSSTIAKEMQKFTKADLSGLQFHANYISREEESPSRFHLGRLFCSPGGNGNYLKFLCVNAHKEIDNFDRFKLGHLNGNTYR